MEGAVAGQPVAQQDVIFLTAVQAVAAAAADAVCRHGAVGLDIVGRDAVRRFVLLAKPQARADGFLGFEDLRRCAGHLGREAHLLPAAGTINSS